MAVAGLASRAEVTDSSCTPWVASSKYSQDLLFHETLLHDELLKLLCRSVPTKKEISTEHACMIRYLLAVS